MRYINIIIALTLFATNAWAAASSSVEVNVDVTASNAAIAREQAMAQANRQAIKQVAANLTTQEGIDLLNQLNNEQLVNFIKEITVLDEKSSQIRYIAKLNVVVYEQLLSQYLQEKNVAQSSELNSIMAMIDILNLNHWLIIEKKISSLPMVNKIEIKAIGNNKAQFQINYNGNIDNLLQSIKNLGMAINTNGNIYNFTQTNL